MEFYQQLIIKVYIYIILIHFLIYLFSIANYNSILYEKNGLNPYVEGLKVDENSLKSLLLKNLFNYTYKGENRKIISKLNGVEIMCQNCTNITDDNKDNENEVHIKLCNMLWKLGFDSEKNRKAIFDNNGIEYLIKNIMNSNNDKLVIQSCSALWTMTSYDGVVKILVKSDIIVKLMEIINQRIKENDNHKLFIPICGIIEKLSLISIYFYYYMFNYLIIIYCILESVQPKILEMNGIKLLLKLIEERKDVEDYEELKEGEEMKNDNEGEEKKDDFNESKTSELSNSLKKVNNEKERIELRVQAMKILLNLSGNETIKNQITTPNLVLNLLGYLQDNSNETTKLKIEICKLLSNLVNNNGIYIFFSI